MGFVPRDHLLHPGEVLRYLPKTRPQTGNHYLVISGAAGGNELVELKPDGEITGYLPEGYPNFEKLGAIPLDNLVAKELDRLDKEEGKLDHLDVIAKRDRERAVRDAYGRLFAEHGGNVVSAAKAGISMSLNPELSPRAQFLRFMPRLSFAGYRNMDNYVDFTCDRNGASAQLVFFAEHLLGPNWSRRLGKFERSLSGLHVEPRHSKSSKHVIKVKHPYDEALRLREFPTLEEAYRRVESIIRTINHDYSPPSKFSGGNDYHFPIALVTAVPFQP